MTKKELYDRMLDHIGAITVRDILKSVDEAEVRGLERAAEIMRVNSSKADGLKEIDKAIRELNELN